MTLTITHPQAFEITYLGWSGFTPRPEATLLCPSSCVDEVQHTSKTDQLSVQAQTFLGKRAHLNVLTRGLRLGIPVEAKFG